MNRKQAPEGFVDINRKWLGIGALGVLALLMFLPAIMQRAPTGGVEDRSQTGEVTREYQPLVKKKVAGVIPAVSENDVNEAPGGSGSHNTIGSGETDNVARIADRSEQGRAEDEVPIVPAKYETDEGSPALDRESEDRNKEKELTPEEKLRVKLEEAWVERQAALYTLAWEADMAPETGTRVSLSKREDRAGEDKGESDNGGSLSDVIRKYVAAAGKAGSDTDVQAVSASESGPIAVSTRESGRDPYRIRKGAVLHATLLEPIDSEMPGIVTASLNEGVFDTDTGRNMLIPPGSRLVGTYQTEKVGGKRLGVFWSELQMPDGTTIDFGGMPAGDISGVSGVPARRDSQFFKALGAAALISVVTAGMETIARRSDDSDGYESIYRQETARNVLGLSEKVLSRAMNVADRFRTKAGEKITVRITRDLVFPGGNND